MNGKFLEIIAEQILSLSNEEVLNLNIILPNRRAGVFLQKHLAELNKKTTWLPNIYSIEDFVFELSGFQKASSTDLIFELYETYLKLSGDKDKSFEDFGSFGPNLLKDFNDIDNFLADSKVVFTYLTEARALQKWNPNSPHSGNLEKNYLNFYSSLGGYYNDFKAKLLEQNFAYYGMAIRHIIENITKLNPSNNQYYIVGFNSISKAEEKLFELISENGKAITFLDADEHYLNNKRQEAGRHLQLILNNPKLKVQLIKSNGFNSPKEISLYGLSGEFGMTKFAAQIIKEWVQEPDFQAEETAIILPDEELLFPLLSSLPAELTAMNITMSYPFRKTAGYDLVIRIFEIYESVLRNKSRGNLNAFHYKALKAFFDNTLIKRHFNQFCRNFSRIIQNENISIINSENINQIIKEIDFSEKPHPFKFIEINNLNGEHVLNSIINSLKMIEELMVNDEFEKAIIVENNNIIERLNQKITQYNLDEEPNILKKIYQSMANLNGISFEGKPLSGLQIMGVLETRTIDFKRIIYLTFNEGQIPAAAPFHSYILPEIRYHFGLPMPTDEDAISAYHFYRSIQRAEKVLLIHNTVPGNLGGGEMSRFGKQLMTEVKNDNVIIKSLDVELPNPKNYTTKEIIIEKDEKIMNELVKIATNPEGGFSPSSLSMYLSCPLKFYFRRVLHIKPLEEVEEEIAINTRGSAIHETLDQIYKNEAETKNEFGEDFFKNAVINYQNILTQSYSKIFKKGDINHGYNLILRKLDEHMIELFLKNDLKYSFNISDVKCEQNIEAIIPLKANGEEINIRLFGNADRIDSHKGVRRIIDYKTGKIKETELKINPAGENDAIWEKIFVDGEMQKTFQLLMYSFLYHQSNPNQNLILPVIAAMKTNKIFFELKPKNGFIDSAILNEFSKHLISVLNDILNKEIPFNQTSNKKACGYCDYKLVCNK